MNYEKDYQDGFKEGYEYGFKDGYFEGLEYIRELIDIKKGKEMYKRINMWLENIKKYGIIDKYIEDSRLDQSK